MASGDGEGFVWLCLIGLAVWVYSDSGKVKAERDERIDSVFEVDQKVSALETRIIALERDLKSAREDVGRASRVVGAVADQVQNNARVANENAIADMTAAGACGRETVYYENGGYTVRNKQCTVKDLKP